MKKLVLIFVFCLSPHLYADIFHGCGVYQLRGKLSQDLDDKLKVKYVVLEKTNSEKTFHFDDMNEVSKIAPYLDQFTEIEITINQEMNGTKGIISAIKAVKLAIPNPLKMDNDFLKLSSVSCKKRK